jgi:galactose-1-phosphate uridylyltransferase
LDTIHAVAPIDAKRPFSFVIVTKDRSFYLRAGSEEQMQDWISQIKIMLKNNNNDPPKSPALVNRVQSIEEQEIDQLIKKAESVVESIITTTSFITTESNVVVQDMSKTSSDEMVDAELLNGIPDSDWDSSKLTDEQVYNYVNSF